MRVAAGIEAPEAELADICRRFSIKELALFGSAAREQMRPESDLDLLVEFLPDAPVSLLDHFAAQREFSNLLGRKVDLVSKRAVGKRLREEILREAKLIYAA